MGENNCSLGPGRDDRIVAYLYDHCEPAERRAFESHVGICVVCQTELAELETVRAHLGRWSPPEPRVLSFIAPPVMAPPVAAEPSAPPRGFWGQVAAMPGWAQAAAAVLMLGVAAGAANVQVSVDEAGFSVRTGWLSAVAPADASAAAGQAPQTGARQADAPWRADLVLLEQQLRAELKAASSRAVTVPEAVNAGGAPVQSADDVARKVRALIDESERKQQRELALRVAELARDSQTQRQADFAQINRSLGFIQANTGAEMMRNRQRLNSLAVQVNQTRD